MNEAGYAVDLVTDGAAGLDYFLAVEYDLILLDIMLSKRDGLQLIKELRHRNLQTPMLVLTAWDEVGDRIKGLDAGADDYLVKPFSFSKSLARMRTLLRRPPLQADTLLQVGSLAMDRVQHEGRCGHRLIDLSPREFALLEYLLRCPDQVLTQTQIA